MFILHIKRVLLSETNHARARSHLKTTSTAAAHISYIRQKVTLRLGRNVAPDVANRTVVALLDATSVYRAAARRRERGRGEKRKEVSDAMVCLRIDRSQVALDCDQSPCAPISRSRRVAYAQMHTVRPQVSGARCHHIALVHMDASINTARYCSC